MKEVEINMLILINNNPNKVVDPGNYDKIIYLGFTPEKDLEQNESVLLDNEYIVLSNFYHVSIRGLIKGINYAKSKKDLELNYLPKINQIVLNERNTSATHITETEEILQYVGLNNHLELNLD